MAQIIVSVLAGLLAGFGTGFAGLSAAVFIAPMLTAFLHVDSFSAIGIALASDVLASAASGAAYYRYGNTELKKCRILMATVILFAVIGSVAAHIFTGMAVGESIMGWWLVAASLLLGLKLLVFPSKAEQRNRQLLPFSNSTVMVLGGMYIGFVCGFQGTGGGLMLLFVLNILLDIPFKKSVGTSVCIMAVTALIGTASHFMLRGVPDIKLLVICVVFTLLGAEAAAAIANRIAPVTLKRVTGGLMTVSGVAMLIAKLLYDL